MEFEHIWFQKLSVSEKQMDKRKKTMFKIYV